MIPRKVTKQETSDCRPLKADSHIACRAHAIPLTWDAANGLECVFPIWLTQCGRVWFTLTLPCPCCAQAMLWPRSSSQGHGTARLSRDGPWATCLHSASSSYHAEIHKDCYQKHINPPYNNPYLHLYRVVAAHYKKDDLLYCWTKSLDISGYHADFHKGHGNVRAGQGHGMARVNRPLPRLHQHQSSHMWQCTKLFCFC